MQKQLPVLCPGCRSELKVKSLYCENCDTAITGSFGLPVFLKLELREQEFILQFVENSGSLKKMSESLDLSYPTVRNMLNDIIGKIGRLKGEKRGES